MKLSVLQDQFVDAVSAVTRAIDARPVLPVLANVLLVAKGDDLELVASNQELTIFARIGAQLEREGAITVPAKRLSELVNNFASGSRIDLTIDDETQRLTVRSGKTNYAISGIHAKEYPSVGGFSAKARATVDAAQFSRLIHEIAYACGNASSNPVVGAVSLTFAHGVIYAQALDGYRAALTEAPYTGDLEGTYLIPSPSAREVATRYRDGDLDIAVGALSERGHNLLRFDDGYVQIISQLVDGNAIDLSGYIPHEHGMSASVDRQDFVRALRRALVLAREGAEKSIRLSFGSDGIEFHVKSQDVGSGDDFVAAQVVGNGYEVWFDISYLLDALSVFDQGVVTLLGTEGATHLFVRADDNPALGMIARRGSNQESAASEDEPEEDVEPEIVEE